jgi:DNA polymerase I-like protein with 3'-5' exonuclease and polymerase domains
MIRKAPVIVCEREFAVQIWEPGDPVMTDDRLGIDTETELLIPGAPIRPVCVQAASPEKQLVQIAMHPHIDAYFSQLLQANANAVLYMHNAPFDCTVLGLLGSDMLHGWIENNQLVDTCIRFILHALREGSFTGKFSLDTAAKQVLHYQMQGKKKNQAEESVRLSFKQGVEPTDEQLTYAAIDPVVTVLLGEVMHQQLPTEMIQLRGFFGLHWISRRGLLVDTKRLAELKETFQARMAEKAFVLNCFGYYPGDAGNQGVLQHILQVFEKHTGAILPRTEKKQARQINAGINACFEAACGRVPEFVRALRDSDHCAKMLSTYLNEELIGVDGRVHSFFAPLVKTGRTSSSRPNIFWQFLCS